MPNKKIKILFVITQGTWGGAQRYIYDLACSLSNVAHVSVAVGKKDGQELQTKLQAAGVDVIALRHLVRAISPLHDLLALFELSRLYKRLKPDIVHLNSSKAGILGSLARRTHPLLRCIYTVHGWVFLEPLAKPIRFLYQVLERMTDRYKDAIITLSETERNIGIEKLGINPKKITIIPLGIRSFPVTNKQKARQELLALLPANIKPSQIWVGTIANHYRTKGLDILLESIYLLKGKVEDVQFFLIGDGPERKNLQKLIQKFNLEGKVFLIGSAPTAERFLPAFDLFVLPSRKEGLPYTLLEAMYCNVPIIATAVGAIPEMILGKKEGHLVPPADTHALAEAILYAVQNLALTQQWAKMLSIKKPGYELPAMVKLTKVVYRMVPAPKTSQT